MPAATSTLTVGAAPPGSLSNMTNGTPMSRSCPTRSERTSVAIEEASTPSIASCGVENGLRAGPWPSGHG